MRVLLAKTNCDTSLTILALSLGDNVVNHLARRYQKCQQESSSMCPVPSQKPTTLPWRESRIR